MKTYLSHQIYTIYLAFSYLFIALCLSVLLFGCASTASEETQTLEVIRLDPVYADSLARQIRSEVSVRLAEGLELSLWASDTLAIDPVALSMNPQGQVYITRTNRQKNSEFDIRGHRDWMTPSISFKTVEDRRAFLRQTFSPEKSEENSWLENLNGDSLHDWRDLAVEKEQIFRIEDRDGDGTADFSQLYIEDFHEEITDVAGALLVNGKDVFVGVGPDLWRLQDRSGNGMADFKQSISHGYAIHIGFGGHGMSGLTVGPDGKIYWGIGDIGFHVVDQTGKEWAYPNQGAIFRSNRDGSDFEVFATGLRNTHEFVFDKYGNLISVDNDGDHPGEEERVVYIFNGSDSGWRANWQYGKYTDPDNNTYKVWMDEKMYKPRFEGQAAYFSPPIVNYHSGPTGMLYQPGTALGGRWKDRFIIGEFTGSAARSNIYAFELRPSGAGFEFVGEEVLMNGILATGIDWGADGSLYIADWLEGWGTKNKGRIWKLSDPQAQSSGIVRETQRLLQADFSEKSAEELAKLLHHEDMRVRLQAQFALADAGNEQKLMQAIRQTEHQLARIHGIWGMGQLARKDIAVADPLTEFLADADTEIRAQIAKLLGDIRYAKSGDQLISLLADSSARVRFFAAEALGRTENKMAVQPILDMLETNNEKDLQLRLAGAIALARIGEAEPLLGLHTHSSRALRIAAVVALRRMRHVGVARFLQDEDPFIVAEAARAINDDGSIPDALPALAHVLEQDRFKNEALLRRAINACLRVGGEAELQLLADYAMRQQAPEAMRAEALLTMAVWNKPSVLDRVDGRYRGPVSRNMSLPREIKESVIPQLLADRSTQVQQAAAEAAGRLQIKEVVPQLQQIFQKSRKTESRIAALQALHRLKADGLESLMRQALNDQAESVRVAALERVPELDIEATEIADLLANVILSRNTVGEQQTALNALQKLEGQSTEKTLNVVLSQLIAGKIRPEIELDILEAIEAHPSTSLQNRLKQYQDAKPKGDLVAAYKEALSGGNFRRGWRVMMENEAAQCFRCHAIRGNGGDVGPDLTNIGAELSREQLLLSLVDPSARIAPGYGVVSLTLDDGQKMSGILLEETSGQLILQTSDAEPIKIPKNKISQRTNAPSSMPPMGSILSKRELRDVVEFLTRLKREGV